MRKNPDANMTYDCPVCLSLHDGRPDRIISNRFRRYDRLVRLSYTAPVEIKKLRAENARLKRQLASLKAKLNHLNNIFKNMEP